MVSRVGRFVGAGVAAIAVAVAWGLRAGPGEIASDVALAPTAPARGATAPGLAASAPAPRSAVRVVADAEAPLPAEVEAAYHQVVEVGRADGRGLAAAVTDLARVACLAPDAWHGLLARVAASAPTLERGERAAVLALARCSRDDVVRPLAALVADATTPPSLRASLALGLGQLRTLDAEPHGRAAEAHVWPRFDDATLGAPIAEPFVVDALLACLDEAPPRRDAPDPAARADAEQAAYARDCAAFALAGTAAVREDVFARLVAAAARDAAIGDAMRTALRCASGSPWVSAHARDLALAAADGTRAFDEAWALWGTVAPQPAAEAATAVLRDPAASPRRKAALLEAVGACVRPGVPDGAVEELARAADAFAATTIAADGATAPVSPTPEGRASPRAAADDLLLAAVAATGDRSFVVRERAVEAALRVLRDGRRDADGPPPEVVAVFARGDRLTLAILYRLRDAGLEPERLADAVDAALDAPASRGSASAAVEGAIAQLRPLLPDDVRAALDARRAARAPAVTPAPVVAPAGR
ncbi:MAG: hypothetical protein U1E39_02305 [Planctomycetota bacterium]